MRLRYIFKIHRSTGALEEKGRPALDSNTLPKPPRRPIIKEICNNPFGAFSGFGRHCANDFLFLNTIFPGMPSYLICSDDKFYEEFKDAIYSYVTQFSSTKFYKLVSSIPNTENPFSFNETSNTIYIDKYIQVFRRAYANVPKKLYEKYAKLGLLDPDHTIGRLQYFLFFV